MDLNSKSHIQQLKALRNVFLVSFTLASHITKIQRVEMNHGLMLHLSMSGTVFVIISISMFLLKDPVLGMNEWVWKEF